MSIEFHDGPAGGSGTVSLPAPRTDFIGFGDDIVHLATGGQPPLLKVHREAFDRFAADKARGVDGYDHHWEVGFATKRLLAELTRLPPEDHALVGSASEAIGRVISGIDWRRGDNVVVADKDYASGRFALLRLAELGVEPRVVGSDGWYIDPERIVAACDERTRLVYLSHVTSLTGQRFDLQWMSDALHERGIIMLVDASHSLGVVPVGASSADFIVSSAYKFLCATHMGILAWNRERQPAFEPLSIGWASASGSSDGRSFTLHADGARAQAGNSNHLDVYVLERSLEYLLRFGIDAIAAHACRLATRLHVSLSDSGRTVITPAAESERGTSVSFASSEDREIVGAAARSGMLLWHGNGRVRASLHLFNTDDDVDRYVDWLASI